MIYQTAPMTSYYGVMLFMDANLNHVNDDDTQQVIVKTGCGVYKGMTLDDENTEPWLSELRHSGGKVVYSRQPVAQYPGCRERVWGKWKMES